MLELREKHSDPLDDEEIRTLEEQLEIALPSDYVKFLKESSTGLLEFNFAKVRHGKFDDEIGINSIHAPKGVLFGWGNLKDYEEFNSELILPIGDILGAKTLCIGYGELNINQLYVLDTDLTTEKINVNLEELISKTEYCYSPEK